MTVHLQSFHNKIYFATVISGEKYALHFTEFDLSVSSGENPKNPYTHNKNYQEAPGINLESLTQTPCCEWQNISKKTNLHNNTIMIPNPHINEDMPSSKHKAVHNAPVVLL